eukprot:scaffold5198_cov247-Pinguiococcus_pyrenoidosus.AAC.6
MQLHHRARPITFKLLRDHFVCTHVDEGPGRHSGQGGVQERHVKVLRHHSQRAPNGLDQSEERHHLHNGPPAHAALKQRN